MLPLTTPDVSGVGGGGASVPPKGLIFRKSWQNPWKSGQKWRATVSRKTNEDLFWRPHQKRV